VVAAAPVGPLECRGAPELGGEDDESLVEHPARFEVFEEGGYGLVDIPGEGGVVVDVGVGIPVSVGPGVDEFDEADTGLCEPPGGEALPSEVVRLPTP